MKNELENNVKVLTTNECSSCKNKLCYQESSYDWECDLCQSSNLKTVKHLHCVSCETDICTMCFDKNHKPINTKSSTKQYSNLNGHRLATDLFDKLSKTYMECARIQDSVHIISRYERHRQDLPYKGRYDESNLDLGYDSN